MNYILPGIILVAGFLWIGMLFGSFIFKLTQSFSYFRKNKRRRRITEITQRKLIRTRVQVK